MLLKSLNPLVDDTSDPLPNQFHTLSDDTLITFKSTHCCKYNYPKARSILVTSESDGSDTDDEDGKCHSAMLSLKNAFLSSHKNLKWGLARSSHPIPSICNLFYYEVEILNDGKIDRGATDASLLEVY